MHTISLKVTSDILKDMDKQIKLHRFSTRTEFVRAAIRDKLNELENQQFEAEIRGYFRENHDVRVDHPSEQAKRDVFKELEKRFGKR